MMLKICFSARSAYQRVSPMIFNEIRNQRPNTKATFITDNIKSQKAIESNNEGVEVFNIASFIEQHWLDLNLDILSAYEEKYNCAPIWQYIYADRFLIKMPYSYCVKIATGLFMFYETIFHNNGFTHYYDESIATLQSYVAYIVGKAYGVHYLGQMTFRKAETKYHYFVADPFQYMDGFDPTFANKQYSENTVQNATAYLDSFEKSQTDSDIMTYVKSKPKLEFKWALYGLWLFFNKEYHNPCDYINYRYYMYFWGRTNYYFRYLNSQKYYKNPDMSLKYVYLPLHYQPEASTIVCAQKYEKQLFFIDSIAKSLPADTVLYVKEHYALIGHRDKHFYKQLNNYPNIRIISPFESSAELIKNSVAVATLTGTAGWEAMLLRKPVILGGHIYFDNAPGVVKTDDIYLNYIPIMQQWSQPKREDVIMYLCECFSNLGEGCVYFSRREFHNVENINKVATSLLKHLDKMEKQENECNFSNRF